MPLVYREAGPHGPGKGSPLTSEEGDGNIFDLDQRIEGLLANPPEAVSLDHFIVEGTLFTIVLTNGTVHGPFVLPMAQFRWTGPWQPLTTYFIGDIVENDGSLFFIRVQHVSATEFDSDLFTADGQVYILMLAKATQPYDIGMFYNDNIQSGETILMLHVAVRDFTIPADFIGSEAFLLVATTDTPITLPVYKNDSLIGMLTFTPGAQVVGGGQYGTFSMLDSYTSVSFTSRDLLSIAEPYESDSTARGLSVTIVGEVPGL